MADDDKVMQEFNQKVEECKGTIQTCHICGYKGKYDDELDVLMEFINPPKAAINFYCKDRAGCKQRRRQKHKVE